MVGRQVLVLWQEKQLALPAGMCVAFLPAALLPLWQLMQLVAALKML